MFAILVFHPRGKGGQGLRERERAAEAIVAVTINFKRSTFDRIAEAAALLGLDVSGYIGTVAVAAAKEDLERGDRLRWAAGAGER